MPFPAYSGRKILKCDLRPLQEKYPNDNMTAFWFDETGHTLRGSRSLSDKRVAVIVVSVKSFNKLYGCAVSISDHIFVPLVVTLFRTSPKEEIKNLPIVHKITENGIFHCGEIC